MYLMCDQCAISWNNYALPRHFGSAVVWADTTPRNATTPSSTFVVAVCASEVDKQKRPRNAGPSGQVREDLVGYDANYCTTCRACPTWQGGAS